MSLTLNPFERLLANALSPAEQACISYNCLNPERVKSHRHRMIKHLECMSERLQHLQNRLARELPVLAPARMLHIPLICALGKYLKYKDRALTTDLVRGMPIVGEIPRASALPVKETPASLDLHALKGELRVTNRKVLKSLSKSTDLALKQKCWGLAHEEF